MTLNADFNPFSAEYRRDPLGSADTFRRMAPVQLSPFGFYSVWRYEAAVHLLTSSASVEDKKASRSQNEWYARIYDGGRPRLASGLSMLDSDPPAHHRRRAILASALSQQAIRSTPELIDDCIRSAMKGVPASDVVFDFVSQIAAEIPLRVIFRLFGFPQNEIDSVRPWVEACTYLLEPSQNMQRIRDAREASKELDGFVSELLRSGSSCGSFLDHLSGGIDRGELDMQETGAQLVLALLAGYETTSSLLSAGLLALMTHSDQFERLLTARTLEMRAIDEIIRYCSPVSFSRRILLAPQWMHGVLIPRGAYVFICLSSANRDSERWGPSANSLDVTRNSVGHVAFGGGEHRCLGATLARLELTSFIRHLRLARMCFVAESAAIWNDRINLRALSRLPVHTKML